MAIAKARIPTRQTAFDYDRTVVAFHGTRRAAAENLVAGIPFGRSENDHDWLGHGIYFWEYAPQQAWWWAEKKYGADAAVVGALIRLGRCLDLLDPANGDLLRFAYSDLVEILESVGKQPPKANANSYKYLDCSVFNYCFAKLEESGYAVESTRAVFLPGRGRLWPRSGVFVSSHIQLAIREPNNILAVWAVKKDGRYGKEL